MNRCYDKCTVRPFCLTFDDGSNGNSALHSSYIVFNDYRPKAKLIACVRVICKAIIKQYLDKKNIYIFIFAFDVRSKQLLILGIL